MKMLSSGFKREVLILALTQALLTISLERSDEVKDNDVKKRKDNKHYKLDRRIDNRLQNVVDLNKKIIEGIYSKYGLEIINYVKKKIRYKVLDTLTKVDTGDVNLELLTLHILYNNFATRDKPLHEAFKPMADHADYIIGTIKLFDNSTVEHLDDDMVDLAITYIQSIKS